jgi:4-amino-4-deoxy-L-arabinose transferase-like glycosyltransferase
MSAQPNRHWDRETALLAWLTTCVSVFSFLYYFRRGDVLLYGDAVAHINIARRVFDSRTPGLLQLGTVWLPLPHLLMIPFLLSKSMWQTGVGGSIPSMAAYVFGTLGIFRLVRDTLGAPQPDPAARTAAWGAALIYAANPNLIYLQATAMTEAVYLALFVWAVVYFNEFVQETGNPGNSFDGQGVSSSLLKCGICLAAACLTRYDAWILAVAMCAAGFLVALQTKSRGFGASFGKFVLLAAAAPLFWLAYNAAVYRNPLEFANGPYSAKAIEQRTPGAFHPGSHDLHTAFSYFLKAAELNLASGFWQKIWIVLALAGLLACLVARFLRKSNSLVNEGANRLQWWPLLFLWTPLPFYTLSVAYAGVPIFMPVWWPFSYYNVRYGLELLPAFAIFTVLAVYFMARLAESRSIRLAFVAATLAFVVASYVSIWRDPVSFREAWVNSRTRLALERELADFVKALPPNSTILMYLGDHVGALQQAGIPLRRVIYEGNHRTWKQPADAEGLWERALANPEKYADFAIAFDGDAVSAGIPKQALIPLAVIHVSGQPKATIYQTHSQGR